MPLIDGLGMEEDVDEKKIDGLELIDIGRGVYNA
jgi:hypothetical protein